MQESVAKLFGVDVPPEVMVEVVGEQLPRQEGHIHDMELLSDVLQWLQMPEGDSFAVIGPTGSGKSTGVKDVLAATGRKYISITANGSMRFTHLVGKSTAIDGTVFFQYGPLANAMKNGLALIINEFDLMDPEEASALNDILEGEPLVIADNGGETLSAHPDFRFIVTGNTNGTGDSSGGYAGTTIQNIAFMDRFQVSIVGYLEEEKELKLMELKAPFLPANVREGMVKVANEIRALFLNEDSPMAATISTRALLRWARLTHIHKAKKNRGGSPMYYAVDRAVGNRCSAEDRETIHTAIKAVFNM